MHIYAYEIAYNCILIAYFLHISAFFCIANAYFNIFMHIFLHICAYSLHIPAYLIAYDCIFCAYCCIFLHMYLHMNAYVCIFLAYFCIFVCIFLHISCIFLHICVHIPAYSVHFPAYFWHRSAAGQGCSPGPAQGSWPPPPPPPGPTPPAGPGPTPAAGPSPPHPITPPLPTNTHPNKHTLVVIVKPLVQGHRRPSLHHHPSELAPQRGQHRAPARHPGLPQHPARPATFSIQKSAARGPLLRRAQPRLHPTSVPNRPGGCRPSPAQHALA